MKWYCLLLFFICSGLLFAQPRKINAETAIQSVTVFSSGAQILRTANVSLLPGRSEIIFSGLSNQLDQQSLQVKGDAAVTLLSVQTTKDYTGQRKIEQDEKNLVERRNALKDKNNLDEKLLEVYKNEEAMLVKNQAIGGQAGVKTQELKEALDLQRQRLTEVYQKQLDIQNRIQQEQQELQRVGAQLNEISKKRDSINYSVTALIDSKETRNVKFSLLYTVKDAGWYPTYDLRVAEVTQPLAVLMNANVFQRSGETWKDVELELSTGNPAENATPSQLQPWMISYYDPSVAWSRSKSVQPGTATGRVTGEAGEPIPYATITIKGTNIVTQADANGFFKLQNFPQNSIAIVSSVGYEPKEIRLQPGYYSIQLKRGSQQLQEVVVVGYGALQGKVSGVEISDEAATRKRREEIQTVEVGTQYQPTTIIYKIEDKYTVETDGKTTTIGIKKFEVPAQYEYYTAPKLDAAAFLTAKIINWQDYDWQSGEANLYYEGTYLGKTYIDLAAAPDTLSLSLGRDNTIKIGRKLVKEYSSSKFIGSNKTESKQYEITIRNTKKIPVIVTVQDQFPVTTNRDIDVTNTKASDALVDKDTGIITWNLQLPPGSDKKLNIGYTVKYPKDRKVLVD